MRLGILLAFLMTLGLSWLLGDWFGYRQVEQESLEQSFRYRQLVANELNRYLPIPELMAQHPLMVRALQHPDQPELILEANQKMQRMAGIVGSSDVYLMDDTGLTVAASNFSRRDSFVGRRFAYRPYFSDAIKSGDSAIYFALGSTSGVRGLYFSHPLRGDNGVMLGVLAMKVQVDDLESQWHRPVNRDGAQMVVLDSAGISFLASRQDWLYRDFSGRREEQQALEIRQRYPGRQLRAMKIHDLGRPWGYPRSPASSVSRPVREQRSTSV
ncbi:cache domain-containing protein [Marinobacter koreensis]|uniref:cache domain-containing protein n=1 Tax=Marinobacter koreensis TaxID=335974 RepID=UPI00360CF475